MITIRDRASIGYEPISDILTKSGYRYKKDWSFKPGSVVYDNRVVGVFNITAREHCPELETLLALKYSEFVV